jgi:hypothetical protein
VAVGSNPRSVALGDVNGDGQLDLLTANFTSNDVTILLTKSVIAMNGASCNDGNVCSMNDACNSGVCSGVPVPPPAEVGNTVMVARVGGAAVISWNLATNATSSAVLRGLVSGLPVGPGGGDETCLATGLPSNTLMWTDPANPAISNSFWYLIRGDNACLKGPYGYEANNGVPTFPRVTSTCP